jgi:hypothetical protein
MHGFFEAEQPCGLLRVAPPRGFMMEAQRFEFPMEAPIKELG